MIIIVGESGSGKTTIAKTLESYGYHKITTYTTRQPRTGELDGVDYHFISEESFNQLQSTEFFGEVGEYRGWKYGSAISDYKEDSVLVVNPSGMRQIYKNNLNIKIHIFYLNIPRRDRLIKILQRGDDIEEATRRSLSDVGQFDDIDKEADYVIDNNGYVRTPREIASVISILDKESDK